MDKDEIVSALDDIVGSLALLQAELERSRRYVDGPSHVARLMNELKDCRNSLEKLKP